MRTPSDILNTTIRLHTAHKAYVRIIVDYDKFKIVFENPYLYLCHPPLRVLYGTDSTVPDTHHTARTYSPI
jgi:hypothetical protein